MVTDADRLAAAGAELTIAGHVFHVRYTPRSLKMMEDRYGSIQEVGDKLNELQQGRGKVVSFAFSILSMGLQHERIEDVKVDEDWLLDNGDVRDLNLYTQAAFTALVEALPASAEPDPTTPLNGASPNGSTGKRTSGSRSRTSVSLPVSSGTA